MDEPHHLAWLRLLQSQAGVVSRQQAVDAGLTESVIDWRLYSGHWQQLHRGVYATFTGIPARQPRLWAAVLRTGPGSVLSHETAAEIHRLIDKPRSRIHVSVPAGQHPARRQAIRGVVVHRGRGLVAEWMPPWQLPRTSVEDTVLDLIAAARTFDDAYGWIAAAVGRQQTTPQLLGKALAGRSRMRWRGWVAAALEDAADGVHSPLERRYVLGVERPHGLPTAQRQARRRHGSGLRYLDNLYGEYGLCVELDGAAAHPAEGRWRDTRRDNINFVQGVQTMRFGWPDVTEHRCRTAAEVGSVLRHRGWTGTVRRCGPSCTAAGPRTGVSADRGLARGPEVRKTARRGVCAWSGRW